MFRDTASQRVYFVAWNTITDDFETGDAANISAQVSKDGGAAVAVNDGLPTELDATDHPGVYFFDLLQTETDADELVFTAKSTTAGVILERVIIYTKEDLSADHGTAQAGSGTTITLRSGASASNDVYNNHLVYIVSGTGANQCRIITDYVGSTKVATVHKAWDTNPNSSSHYVLYPFSPAAIEVISGSNQAAVNMGALYNAGVTKAAVNDLGASATSFVTTLTEATDNHYKDGVLVFTSGNLQGQVTLITAYTGSTKTITCEALTEAPADTDEFVILGKGA